ncbi:MAG TPA: isocitrate lyase/phosphoenolpyruvate mutase family protein [Bauldia sp.]|nr:isocitrate lyase/phosphoenolpyruvate mutase family protein [Bauldia sp.]
MPTVAEKRRAFRALHETGCFVIPNPWDVGSARYLQGLGFKALATTSSGLAWSLGYADGAVPLDAMLAHFRALVEATDVPINADFLAGFAVEPEQLAINVARCIATGVAGLSIEDATADVPVLDFDLAVKRVRAARAAIDTSRSGTLLVARSEVYFSDHPQPLKEAIRRLVAFAEAGADCLYAPGTRSTDDVAAIVKAVAPKPVNVLVGWESEWKVADLAALGVRRVSVGGALARTAWAGFQRAAAELATHGSFGGLAGAASGAALNQQFTPGT